MHAFCMPLPRSADLLVPYVGLGVCVASCGFISSWHAVAATQLWMCGNVCVRVLSVFVGGTCVSWCAQFLLDGTWLEFHAELSSFVEASTHVQTFTKLMLSAPWHPWLVLGAGTSSATQFYHDMSAASFSEILSAALTSTGACSRRSGQFNE